ncbi:hypothetical protein FRB96_007501 [Tulasnella sp. 330]|nr:hypothetical protein FRB96_007501 [Tulasnella sp. 330]KAG8881565.1 hypothetical protein FRB97_009399 [Tulasnella sp. 331]
MRQGAASTDEEVYQGTSIRWKHFDASYKLAAKKVSMGWSYEDFAQCVPDWAESNPEAAHDVFSQVSDYMYTTIIQQGETVLLHYNAARGIDELHQTVLDAKTRAATGEEPGMDTWRGTLDPNSAVRVRVTPVLQEEKQRLETVLAELEAESNELTANLKQNEDRRAENEGVANKLLDALEQAAATFNAIPEEPVQMWTIEAQEGVP